jgi:hypothetical protein
MAKQDNKSPQTIVQCAHCGKRVLLNQTISFGEFDKKRDVQYFCDIKCALAKLFGIVDSKREFILGLENGR